MLIFPGTLAQFPSPTLLALHLIKDAVAHLLAVVPALLSFSHDQGHFCNESDAEMFLNKFYCAELAYWQLRMFLILQQFSLKIMIPAHFPVSFFYFYDIVTIILPLVICLSLVL